MMKSLQASASFEGVAKERGEERKGELPPLFSTPCGFTARERIFSRLGSFAAQDEELTHRLQNGWAPSQVK